MTTFNAPSLPFEDFAVLDAQGLSRSLSGSESLYITYANGKYYLKTRRFDYEVDWDLHYQVNIAQAREIVRLGYAEWWFNVDKSVR